MNLRPLEESLTFLHAKLAVMLLRTLLLAFAVVAYASYDEPILGISLGKRDLIVVQSLENGSTSLIARVSVNATYTDWFEQMMKLPEQKRSA